MEIIFSILFQAILGLVVANIASNKGRGFANWFIYGFLVFPIAIIHSLAIKKDENSLAEKSRKKEIKEPERSLYTGDDLEGMAFFYLGPSAAGFIFLIWFSSLPVWIVSVLSACLVIYVHLKLLKKFKYFDDDGGTELNLFAIALAATIYFSAPFTDSAAYCEKQYETTWTPTLRYSDNRFSVKDKMSMYNLSSGCDSGNINLLLFFISMLGAIYYFAQILERVPEWKRKKTE